ncbi:MAG: hypothetical protein ACRDRV_13120 [Pseudonocardiaceae bacterium]
MRTPAGERGRVLPYDTKFPDRSCGDAVFVQPLHPPGQPWQLWSSGDLVEIPTSEPDAT